MAQKKIPSGHPRQVDFCVGQILTNLPDKQGYKQAARKLS